MPIILEEVQKSTITPQVIKKPKITLEPIEKPQATIKPKITLEPVAQKPKLLRTPSLVKTIMPVNPISQVEQILEGFKIGGRISQGVGTGVQAALDAFKAGEFGGTGKGLISDTKRTITPILAGISPESFPAYPKEKIVTPGKLIQKTAEPYLPKLYNESDIKSAEKFYKSPDWQKSLKILGTTAAHLPIDYAAMMADIYTNPTLLATFGLIGKVITAEPIAKWLGKEIPAPKWVDDSITNFIHYTHKPFETLNKQVRENRLNATVNTMYAKFTPQMREEINTVIKSKYPDIPNEKLEGEFKNFLKARFIQKGYYDVPLLKMQQTINAIKRMGPQAPEVKPITPEPTPPKFTGRPAEFPPAVITKTPFEKILGTPPSPLPKVIPAVPIKPKITLEEIKPALPIEEQEEKVIKTISDVEKLIVEKSKQYGNKNAFFASDEYKKLYPQIEKIYAKSKVEFVAKGQKALEEVGIKIGDRVSTLAQGFAGGEEVSGIVVMRSGIPYVKLDSPQMTNKGYKKEVQWHKGWKKVMGKAEQPKAGGLVHEVPEYVKKKLEQGVTITKTKVASFRMTKPITVKDIHQKEISLPKGHEFSEVHLSNGKIWLHDGKNLVVDKSTLTGLPKDSYIELGEKAVPPEEAQVEEVVKGGKELTPTERQEYEDLLIDVEQGNKLNKQEMARYKELEQRDTNKITTKFSQYQLPGGENYREVLFKVPSKAKPGTFDDLEESRNAFKSSHWDEPNVIAHARLNDRFIKTQEGLQNFIKDMSPEHQKYFTDRFNEKGYLEGDLIEEIQSDWARQMRERGTKGLSPEEIKILNEAKAEQDILRKKINVVKKYSKDDLERFKQLEDKIVELEDKLENPVPFHSLLKNWQEFTLKRLLSNAIKNDKDFVAWTTGEQQAERYDLSKQVDSLEYYKQGKNYKIFGTKNDNTIIEQIVPDDKLDALVGKEIAKRIREGEGKSTESEFGKGGVLEGTNLQIGGEWAKNLYDKQIPNILKDLTRGEVGSINLGKHITNELRIIEGPDTWQVFTIEELNAGGMPEKEFDTKIEAQNFINKNKILLGTQPALMITPEIKARIVGEQPRAGGKPIKKEEQALTKDDIPEEIFPLLTRTEEEVANAIIAGKTVHQMAREFDWTPDDVRKEIGWLKEKIREIKDKIEQGEISPKEELEIPEAIHPYDAEQLKKDRENKQSIKQFLAGKIDPKFKKTGEFAEGLEHLPWLFAKESDLDYKKYGIDELRGELNALAQKMGVNLETDDDTREFIKYVFEDEIQKRAEEVVQKKISQPYKPKLLRAPRQAKPAKPKRQEVQVGRGSVLNTRTDTDKSIQGKITADMPFTLLGRTWTPEQRKQIYIQALKKGLIYKDLKGKQHDRLHGLLARYKDASFGQIRDYISALTGSPQDPPKIFALYGDIHKDTDALKILQAESENWQDINKVEMTFLDRPRIIEKVTGKGLWEDNILADNYFYTISSADELMFDRLQKEVDDLEKNKEGIQKGKQESADLMRKAEQGLPLTPKEQKVADYIRKKYDQLLDEMNDVRRRYKYPEIPRRKNYWTHIQDENIRELAKEFFKGDDEKLKHITPQQIEAIRKGDYTKGNMPFNKFAQKRYGTKTKYDAIGNYEKYLRTALKEIYYTPAIAHARKFIEYTLKRQPNAYKALDRLLNELKGKPSLIDEATSHIASNRYIRWLRSRLASSALVGNVNFWAINLSNFSVSYDELGNYLNKGMIKFLGEKEWRDFAFTNSQMLKGRSIDPDIDPSTFKNITDAISHITNLIEYNNVGSTFVGAYLKGVEDFGYKKTTAIKYADAIARRTQAGYKKYELPAWMSSNTGMLLSQFQTWSFNMMNHVLYDIGLANLPKKLIGAKAGKMRWGAFWKLLITTIIVNQIYGLMKLRKPYEAKSFIPKIPFITTSRYEEPAVFSYSGNIGKAFLGKTKETREKATVRAATGLFTGGTQIGRFLTGRIFPEEKEKKAKPKFTGRIRF